MSERTNDTDIEAHLPQNEYMRMAPEDIDREGAIFSETVLAFIRETQPKERVRLEALHGERTGEQILNDLCKWMDRDGSPAPLSPGLSSLQARPAGQP